MRLLRGVQTAWAVACWAALVLLVGTRWLRYASWSAAPGLDPVLRELMVFDGQAFLWPWAYTTVKLPVMSIAVALVVAGRHRRLLDGVLHRVDGAWALRPLAASLALLVILWFHYLLDLNPTIASLCFASLVLLWLTNRPRFRTEAARTAVVLAWAGLFLYWLVAAGDRADRIAIVAWGIVLVLTDRYLRSRVRGAELFLLRLVGVMVMNLLPAVLPLWLPMHGGTKLGEGLAYSFCEVPNRGTVYATVPVCDSLRNGYEQCRDGRVVEYDLATLRRVAAYDFFSPAFYGRLELIVCLDDEVQVSVQSTVYQGRALVQSAMSFPVAAPQNFTPVLIAPSLGNTIAYDRAHDALFYTAEFNDRVVRYDRISHEIDDTASRNFARRWYQPVSLEDHDGSSTLTTESIYPERNRAYLAEWMQGRYAYALDLATLRPVARYDVGGGGAMGIAVDPGRDRLIVTSLWGIEVFDLATDRLIARRRAGTGNRPVVLDAARNRLYVSSTFEGKIRVYDRDTLTVVGQIPIGIGTRYPHLSRDGRYLFASSAAAHYYWNADDLVPPR